MKERGDGAQQDAIEFSFDDEIVAEVVEVEADDVEDSVGDEREAVEEEDFFEAPAGELRNFLEQDDDEAERENGGGEAGAETDEEIAAVADADFGVLREVVEEEEEVAMDRGREAG